jgi:aminopeptidase N
MKNKLLFLLFACFSIITKAQITDSIDVIHYDLTITVNDFNDEILVTESIDIKFLNNLTSFSLNFVNQTDDSLGMEILQLQEGTTQIDYAHTGNKLTLFPKEIRANETRTFHIFYKGIPADGLIISENKFKDRTFFGDNWPNRAQNWFACIDHPSDKATITYLVEAPIHYQIIANGNLKFEKALDENQKQVKYETEYPIPTKVMVIGIGDFAIEKIENEFGFELSSWVYPKDKKDGFHDFALSKEILLFFTNHLGAYPFEKLANVQSTTRYGGMENASCIFYDEESITGNRTCENLIVHEIAHQWFGNSASETDWEHLWLSEGFATYLTNLYILETKGENTFQKQMEKDRERVFRFYTNKQTPIVDTLTSDLNELLNTNAYQKGAWVLHMMRNEIGDSLFWLGLNNYYQSFKYSNASTSDFISSMEKTSGKDLSLYTNQWLKKAGHPQLKIQKLTSQTEQELILEIKQVQLESPFTFQIEIQINYEDGSKETRTIDISKKMEQINIPISKKVKSWEIDPDVKLLFQVIE